MIPKEYKSIDTLTKRLNKLSAKVLLEEMTSEHNDMASILKGLSSLRNHIDQVLNLNSKVSHSTDTDTNSNYNPTVTNTEPNGEYADENASF